MATTIQPETTSSILPVVALEGEQRVVLNGVSYELYKRICEEVGEQPVRLSFSDESLEIMNTKRPHGHFRKILSMLVEATLRERKTPMWPGGMMTFQRDELEKGFEPDDCWWIASASKVSENIDFDSAKDPPPDLAIEVEITSSLIHRIGIYAAMGVPEVWRFNGKKLRFCLLQSDGTYADSETSRSFPFLKPRDLMPFLLPEKPEDATTRINAFVEWLGTQDPQ
jgi:Uma2 family endonuclease